MKQKNIYIGIYIERERDSDREMRDKKKTKQNDIHIYTSIFKTNKQNKPKSDRRNKRKNKESSKKVGRDKSITTTSFGEAEWLWNGVNQWKAGTVGMKCSKWRGKTRVQQTSKKTTQKIHKIHTHKHVRDNETVIQKKNW